MLQKLDNDEEMSVGSEDDFEGYLLEDAAWGLMRMN